jgi:ketosteroid isomerase-like protein
VARATNAKALNGRFDIEESFLMTVPGESNQRIAQTYLAGVAKGNLDIVDQVMTEDVTFTIISAVSPACKKILPWAGSRHGREAVKGYFRELSGRQENRIDGIERWVCDEYTAVAFATLHARSIATGKSGAWEVTFRFDFENGLIARHLLYEDSFSAAAIHAETDMATVR